MTCHVSTNASHRNRKMAGAGMKVRKEIELLLEIMRSHAASSQFKGKDWESVKSDQR